MAVLSEPPGTPLNLRSLIKLKPDINFEVSSTAPLTDIEK